MKRIITIILSGIIAFFLVFTGIMDTVDKSAEDVLYHRPGAMEGKIKIIKIDDKSMNQLGDFSTWNRDVWVELLDKLCVSEEVRPAVIGFDVLFSSQKIKESDNEFAEACAKYNNVVTATSYVFGKAVNTTEDGMLDVNYLSVVDRVEPYEALKSTTTQGFVNAISNADDRLIRHSFVYFDDVDGTRVRSFSSAIYEKYMATIGKEAVYPTDESIMTFRYSGEPGDYESVSLVDVLDGKVPAEAFNGCIVLVGVYAAGMMDSYFVPVDRSTQMYGVEIHANMLQALMEGKTLNNTSKLMNSIMAAVVAMALAFICSKLSVGKLTFVCIGVILAKLIVGYFVFNAGYCINVLAIPIMAVVIAIFHIAEHYYTEYRERKSITNAFSKYVAPQVVDKVAKSGNYELKLGGENRTIAVLFVDIRGFTPLSESLEPEQVVDILNGYLELTTSCVFRHGGTLDKFIGDATMAVFNAPFDSDDYVYKAVLTAWDIVQGGNRIEKEYLARYGKNVGFGVGVNCGPAVVGNIGCDFRIDYTAIGDTVNTAARLEANAPRGTVYISEYVYEQVKDRITVEPIGEIPLKGKSKGVFVYSVTGVNDYISPEA